MRARPIREGTVLPSNLNVFSVISRRPFHSCVFKSNNELLVKGCVSGRFDYGQIESAPHFFTQYYHITNSKQYNTHF